MALEKNEFLVVQAEHSEKPNQQYSADLWDTLQDDSILWDIDLFKDFLLSSEDASSKKERLINIISSTPKNSLEFSDSLDDTFLVFLNSSLSDKDKKEIIFAMFEANPKSARNLISAFPTSTFRKFLKSPLQNTTKKELLTKAFEIDHEVANDFLSVNGLTSLMCSSFLDTNDKKDLLFSAYPFALEYTHENSNPEKLQELAKRSKISPEDPIHLRFLSSAKELLFPDGLSTFSDNGDEVIEKPLGVSTYIESIVNDDIDENDPRAKELEADKQLLRKLLSLLKEHKSLEPLMDVADDEEKKELLFMAATYYKF